MHVNWNMSARKEHPMSWWNAGLTRLRQKLKSIHTGLRTCGIWMNQDLVLVKEQTTKVLVYLDKHIKYKVIGGNQEWVTDIECMSAIAEALPLLLIFDRTGGSLYQHEQDYYLKVPEPYSKHGCRPDRGNKL
jgi:hypothetical protein